MIKVRNVAALLALSSVAALPACSMLDGGSNSSPASHASYNSPRSPALSQDMIQQVQVRLQQAGTYNGRIDGLWGPATETAVRSYQQQHNLNATGQLDSNTLAALNLDGTQQNYGSAQPNSPVYGSNGTAPANTNAPSGNAAQPNSPVYGSNDTAPANTNIPSSGAAQPIGSATR